MTVSKNRAVSWLLLTFTLPTKRASQRVEVWRKLQRYGTVPLGNSGYLLPCDPMNEERFQWLAVAIRKYGGDASVVRVQSIDNISTPQLIARFAEARAEEYRELIREIHKLNSTPPQSQGTGRLSRLRSRFQEIVDVDFFDRPLQKRVAELLARASATRWRSPPESVAGRASARSASPKRSSSSSARLRRSGRDSALRP